MSLPCFRNGARVALLSLVALGSATFAQSGLPSEGTKFLKAVRDGDGSAVTQIVKESASNTLINSREFSTGDTALHIVTARREATWIRFLINNGANPNLANKEGVTPLMLATRIGHIEGVTELLEAGADVDPLSVTGETPLIFAVHRRDVPLVRVLLKHGADPDRTDNSGRSARDYVELIGERRLSEEFADGEAKQGEDAAQQYGPSL